MAHALARIGLGVNIFLHGATRLPVLAQFGEMMQQRFSESILPSILVQLTSYIIVIGEVAVGLLLILGLFLRSALVAGMLLMILLLTGVGLIQDWGAAGVQMVYLGFYAVLLGTLHFNVWSLDARRGRQFV